MNDVTRRAVIGAVAATALVPGFAAAEDTPGEKKDRQRVTDAGFTEAEAECWVLLNRAAGKILSLPKLHPMEEHEWAHAIHVLQDRLMARPAYRKYLELAKAEKK
jgi:hypothetical protein